MCFQTTKGLVLDDKKSTFALGPNHCFVDGDDGGTGGSENAHVVGQPESQTRLRRPQ